MSTTKLFINIIAAVALVIVPWQTQARQLTGADSAVLCQSAGNAGALELTVDELMVAGLFDYSMAPQLLTLDCNGVTLIQRMIDQAQAENLEFAVIDLGVNVNRPLVPVEAGRLSVVQYLMRQAVVAASEEAREFSLEYMDNFRSVDFNPNLQLVTLR